MGESLAKRLITVADIELICRHRQLMFEESGRDAERLARMTPAFRRWLAAQLPAGIYSGFVLENDAGVPIASIGFQIIAWPPHPDHPESDVRGYVLNLFVEPEYRGQGVAADLMQSAEHELARQGAEFAILHATRAAIPLYERLGWSRTSEMAKPLE